MATDNTQRDADRAWDLMKKIGFAMLVTHDGDKLRARPMSAYLEREENAIYFLTDARRHKDEEIARNPGVNLSFANASDQKYVSVTGTSGSTATSPVALLRRIATKRSVPVPCARDAMPRNALPP